MNHSYEFISDRSADSVIQNLKKYGVALVPRYLSEAILQSLNIEFDKTLSDKSNSVFSQSKHPVNKDGRVARLDPWHKDAPTEFPEISTVFRDDFMAEIASEYYSPYPHSFNETVFITHELPSPVHILPWHFDRVQSLKFWINLTDTTQENGAFEYCPGTHWEGRYRAGFHLSQGVGVQDIPNDIDDDLIRNPVTMSLNAGDLLIFDADGFHRGGVVQPGHERRVLRAHTYPTGRRYGDPRFSAGWWVRSPLNINRWLRSATSRIIGEKVQERTANRHLHDVTKGYQDD